MTGTVFVGVCEICGHPVAASKAAYRVRGWEVTRRGGGANRILGRERVPDTVAHFWCAEREVCARARGDTPGARRALMSQAVSKWAPDPDYDRLARTGEWLAAAEGKPGDRQAAMTAALRLAYARDLGLKSFQVGALSVIAGKLVVSVDLLRGLAHRAGYRVVKVEESATHCTAAVITSEGEELGRATFTMADAERANLVKRGGSWVTYPQRMLWHRAAKNAMADAIPDVVYGLNIEDEADELAPVKLGRVEAEPLAPGVVEPTSAEPTTPDASAPEPAPGSRPDTFTSYEQEQEWRAAERREALRRAHAQLAITIREVEQEGHPPPAGHDSWTDYSRWLAQDRWGVESRSELDPEQVQALVEEVDHAAGMVS